MKEKTGNRRVCESVRRTENVPHGRQDTETASTSNWATRKLASA